MAENSVGAAVEVNNYAAVSFPLGLEEGVDPEILADFPSIHWRVSSCGNFRQHSPFQLTVLNWSRRPEIARLSEARG